MQGKRNFVMGNLCIMTYYPVMLPEEGYHCCHFQRTKYTFFTISSIFMNPQKINIHFPQNVLAPVTDFVETNIYRYI